MTALTHVTTRVDDLTWDRMVAACPCCTFYHTRKWAEICAAAFANTRPEPRLYRFDDGVEVLLPGTVETGMGGALRVFRSTHPSEFGGLVPASRLSEAHTRAIAEDLKAAGYSGVLVYENPFSVQPPLPGFKQLDDFTQAVRVDDGVDGFVSRMSSKERQSLRRGLKAGVVIEEHVEGEGVEDLYAMYLRSSERWGDATTWLRPFELLRVACEQADASFLRIRLARYEGRVIGGSAEYHQDRVTTLVMRGFDYEYRSCYPNLLLLLSTVQTAHDRGAEYVDLGPSAGLENVVESKERLGATRLGFRQWTWEHPLHRVLVSGRRRISNASAAVRALASR